MLNFHFLFLFWSHICYPLCFCLSILHFNFLFRNGVIFATRFAFVWVCCSFIYSFFLMNWNAACCCAFRVSIYFVFLYASNFLFAALACASMLALEAAISSAWFSICAFLNSGLRLALSFLFFSLVPSAFSAFLPLQFGKPSICFPLLWAVIFVFPCNPRWNWSLRMVKQSTIALEQKKTCARRQSTGLEQKKFLVVVRNRTHTPRWIRCMWTELVEVEFWKMTSKKRKMALIT